MAKKNKLSAMEPSSFAEQQREFLEQLKAQLREEVNEAQKLVLLDQIKKFEANFRRYLDELDPARQAAAQVAFIANHWKSHIDQYDLPTQAGSKSGVELLEKGRDVLLEGAQRSTSEREKFLEYLANVHFDIQNTTGTINQSTISMESLLGTEGLALYHAAIREEDASQAFREAVFNASTKKYDGPKWDKRLVLWVGGPSASGKTAASERAVNMIGQQLMTSSNPTSTEGNYVVSIDGGVEREMSQMRQMVLQVALSKGYKGIEDLHANTKLRVKNRVKKAALANGDLNLVIPETFSASLASGVRAAEMRKFEENSNTEQVFTEVRADKSASRFQRTVRSMGESRAWYQKSEQFPVSKIAMNNRNIGCESKVYEPENFKWGKFASRRARNKFLKISKNGHYYKISHDLMYVTKGANNEWRECNDKDTNVSKVLISEKNFEIWKLMNKGKLTSHDLASHNLNEWKKYLGFDEKMDLDKWASFCYKHRINPSPITKERRGHKARIKLFGVKLWHKISIIKNPQSEIKQEVVSSTASSHRVSAISPTFNKAAHVTTLQSEISDVNLRQTQANIRALANYLDSKKADHPIIDYVERSSPESKNASVEITFKNSNGHEPKVVAQNSDSQNTLNFSAKRNLSQDDFAFVAEQTAKMAVAMAQPGTVFDLTLTPDIKRPILENALRKAIDEAVRADPVRYSGTAIPTIQGGTRPPETTSRLAPT